MLNRFLSVTLALVLLVPVQAAETAPQPQPVATSRTAPASIALPLPPSQMLDASESQWSTVHAWVAQQLQLQESSLASLDRDAQIQLRISQSLLAQSQGQWERVTAPVERARRLQHGQPGQYVSGLLNELLAEKQRERHGDAWLRSAMRDRILAMPWNDVAGVIQQLRQQLQGMQEQAIRQYVANRLDLSAGISKGQVSLGFVMQLMGARIQLRQVLSHREALLQGLNDALSQRPTPPARVPQAASAPVAG
jgi:hypothetical protein